jgi:ParB/RepB/Spo0J family partition protein
MARATPNKRTRKDEALTVAVPRIQGAAEHSDLRQISVDSIDVPRRPARRFMGDIAALAESMQEYGLQQPICVRADGNRFIVTSGMRRLAAARILRWETITAFVRSVNADDAYLLDLIENIQREDLSPEEEADAFGELIRTRGWTLQQVADSVKRSVGYISKRVRVFEDPLLREAIVIQSLPVSTAEELLASDPESRAALIQRAVTERWDQVQARDALRPLDVDAEVLDDEAGLDELAQPAGAPSRAPSATRLATQSSVRPKGLTRAVREFHRLVMTLRAEYLTKTDRSALRALFRDLVFLARSPATPPARVFPALPTIEQSAASRSRTTGSRRRGTPG